MSKSFISASFLCLLLSSCIKEELLVPAEVDADFTAEVECFDGSTKTSLNEQNSIEWSENDRIAVFQGNSVADIFEVTPSSVGRTTAVFREVVEYAGGDFIAGNELETNVAVYPYVEGLECSNSTLTEEGDVLSYKIDNVELPSVQKWQSSSFADDAFVMLAVTEGIADRKLRFRNVCGALRLRVSGDAVIKHITIEGHSGERLSGSASVDVCADGTTAPVVSMHSSASETVTLDCGDGVRLSTTSPIDFIIALPPTSFTKGFTVTLTDVNGKKDVRSSDRSNVIRRSIVLTMPEITFGEGDLTLDKCTDIAAEETANCYIISKSGSYSFPAVKGNGTKSVGTVASVDVLWETFGTDEEIHKGDLISSVAYQDGKILFRTASRLREGNAVIAAKNSSGTILWSWHIWLTDQPQEHVYRNGAGIMMDRNIGATSATPGDVGALGLNYQWGRKDPFLGSADIHSSVAVASTLKWPNWVSTSSTIGTVSYSIANPTVLINNFGDDSDHDWLYNSDSSLWSAEKTIYDPCPAGWRVPDGGSKGVWSVAGFDRSLKYDHLNEGVNLPVESPDYTWYPAADPIGSSQRGTYWSVTTSGNESYHLIFYDNSEMSVSQYATYRYFQESVRCFKEGSAAQMPPSMENAEELTSGGETANCYIVSKKGNYKFKAVKGNSSTSVGAIASVEVLWETYGTSTKPSVGSLVKSPGYYDGYVSFSTADSFKEGNALIAVKDASGTILWSWHIWLTDKPSEQRYRNGAGIMMDRNLGATSASKASVSALGLLYQWGRKDPFLGSSSINSSVIAKSTITWPSTEECDSKVGTVEYAISHPTTFIGAIDDDWLYDSNNKLWTSSKTIYDPCPPGWKVPDGGDDGVWKVSGKPGSNDYDNSGNGISFPISSPSTTWYPAASGRHYQTGNLVGVGNYINFWSSTSESDGNSYGFYYDITFSNMGLYSLASIEPAACAYSVRCLKD